MLVRRRHGAVSASAFLGIAALAGLSMLSGCAPAEPEGPPVVHPSDAQSIDPPAGVELSDHECLVGGWTVTGEPLEAYLDSFGPGTELDVSGELSIGFTLERYAVTPQVGVTWQNRGTETLSSLVGEAEGGYRFDDSTLEIDVERDDIEFVDVEDGERSDVSNLFLYSVTSNPLLNAAIECAGDALTIVSAADSDGVTVTVTLERTR